jgi:Zn-dependent protease
MNFRIGRIPVQVHGSFFLTMLLFSAGNLKNPAIVAAWIAAAFVGVLLHELGHAYAGRAFGLAPAIQLHGMGGVTTWVAGKRLSPAKQIVISLAGPLVGIGIGLPLLLLAPSMNLTPLQAQAVDGVVWVNLGWGVLNLLPILPMDGGNIMSSFFQLFSPKHGETAARVVSMGVAATVGGAAVFFGFYFGALLAGLYLVRNFQALRAGRKAEVDEVPLAAAMADAYAALDRQDGATAIRIAEPVLLKASSNDLKVTAIRVLAYARMLEGQWGHVMAILERFAPIIGAEELGKFERTALELGRTEDAKRIKTLRIAEETGVIPEVEGFKA